MQEQGDGRRLAGSSETKQDQARLLYSIPELSDLFGLRRSTLYSWAHRGWLTPADPPPHPLLFSLAALERALSQAQAKQPLAWYLKLRKATY
jgi:hypothetical protein